MQHTVVVAETEEEFAEARRIINAYADFLGIDLGFQGFDEELARLNIMYAAPKGCMLLLNVNGIYAGAVGLREHSSGVAEMKRMFVLTEYQGKGYGKELMLKFISKVVELGYKSVVLDTIPELDKAINLYKHFGFTEIEPYRFNPHPQAIFMGRKFSVVFKSLCHFPTLRKKEMTHGYRLRF